jgi:CRISPR-associated Csx3 family protein
MKNITIDVETLYSGTDTAKLASLPEYEQKALELAGNGNSITVTGQGPIWLYLRIAHALHGKVCRLCYDSPVTGEVVIFDHSPF